MSAKHSAAACLSALAIAEPALAHSPIEGIGGFYNGLLHPLLVPAHLLLLIALGIFWGQQGPKRIELALAVFAGATAAGLSVAWFTNTAELEIVVVASAATIGLLIAISPSTNVLWCSITALFAGLFLGIDSAQEELAGKDKMLSLFGSGIAIYLLALYPMVLVEYFNKKAWHKIGVRIIGSWIAASALLVLAFSLSV